MTRRYLFGPVTRTFAEQNLFEERAAGHCLAFDETGTTDLAIAPADSWETVLSRLPAEWRPDFVVLYLPYTKIPECLWSAPVPIVGLAADWNLLWHWYRHCLPRCDLVLTDTVGVEVMRREGMEHGRAANLFGLERDALIQETGTGTAETGSQAPFPKKDIDILFIGNIQTATQRERLKWLGRVARLSERWHVEIHSGVFGEEYWKLMRRARIVFNRSVRGECNKRALETALAGALLVQEESNREVGQVFQTNGREGDKEKGRQGDLECVLYGDHNLETLLDYYLEHEDERRTIAEAGQRRVREYGFERLWEKQLQGIEAEWEALCRRAAVRIEANQRLDRERTSALTINGRMWAALTDGHAEHRDLTRDLAGALVAAPHSATLHNALGLIEQPRNAALAAGHFGRAVEHDPGDLMAGLNLAEALARCDKREAALAQAQRTLAVLRSPRLPFSSSPDLPAWLDAPHYPSGFDFFRVEWERAAWGTIPIVPASGMARLETYPTEADAKATLVRWRLHLLVAELTGEVSAAYEAVLARPDLPVSRAVLGLNLLKAGRAAESIPHLREALSDNPFDEQAALLLFQAYGAAGDGLEQRRLAAQRRLLVKAAPKVVAEQAWFMKLPPAGDELASIIILCCNELEYTRQCLDSVLRQTRQPYELVLIDNGSSGGTAEYLAEIELLVPRLCLGTQGPEALPRQPARSAAVDQPREAEPLGSACPGRAWARGPQRVLVIRNETNRGFPAGCNQGLKQARGQYVVFLNNDTIVTEGWLEGLIAWSLHDWPNVGMVGAVTNYSRPPQQIAVNYPDLNGLDGFAARRRREFAGKAAQVERLTGFCLLVRREVLEQIGGFDERYGLGFFDDDDLCVRARQAGFQLLVAQDVFIHHFGSKTFQALGLDCGARLRENFEQFKAKWGETETARYRIPEGRVTGPSSLVTSEEASSQSSVVSSQGADRLRTTDYGLRTKVSLCMIVRNEEANLGACLESARDLFQEIIIVDTGSTDRTKEIATQFGAGVFDFAWVDNFAAARNECLRHATGDWIVWLDADDRLDEENRHKLTALIAGLRDENVAYSMKCVCLPDPLTGTATVVDHIRLFRNQPGLRWKYRVHEQILPAVRQVNGEVRFTDVVIHHVGYQDAALRRRKLERDLRLLHLENGDQPDDPFTLFNLGCVFQELGQVNEALPMFQRSLQRSAPADSIVRKLYALIAQCHRRLQEQEPALAACRAGLAYYPEDCELLFQEGLLLRDAGDRAGAERRFLRLLEKREGPHFASLDMGLRGYKARHNLGVLYAEQGRLAEAAAQWRAALTEQPEFEPALACMEELQKRTGALRSVG